MIFVTVGTHEQSFDRLIKYIDDLKKDGIINEEVIMQIGYSNYKPKYCSYERVIEYNQMIDNMDRARVVITHGGPATFIIALQKGKVPIVVPRQKKFNEHVNDHQVKFVMDVHKRMKIIIPIIDIDELSKTIIDYDFITRTMECKLLDNNLKFNNEFKLIVKDMFNDGGNKE